MPLPSLETTIEQYETAVRQKRVQEIPGVKEAMAAHEMTTAKIRQSPIIVDAEKRRLLSEADADIRAKVAELKEAGRVLARREYDQEEGRLRAEARADGVQASDAEVRRQVFTTQRAQQLAARADRAGTVQATREVYREAMLTQDETTIHLVGQAVEQRLDMLGQAEKGKNTTPIRNAAEQFRQEFGSWQRDHPSLVQRLDQIARGRGQMEVLFEASAQYALDLFGVGRTPQAPVLRSLPDTGEPRRGLVYGSHWDRIQGRK